MKKNNLEFIQIEATGFRDICQRMAELEQENKELKAEIKQQGEELTNFIGEIEDLEYEVSRLTRMKKGALINNSALTRERNALLDELTRIKRMSMFEFSNTYCTAEQQKADGKAFARSLLGVGK